MLQSLINQTPRPLHPVNEAPGMGPVGLAIGVGVAYFLAARLGLLLLTQPDGVAVFWPAAGVSAGLLIALGPSARWPVAAGAFAATIAANLLGDRNIYSALVFALCNVAEALLMAWFVERYFGLNFNLDRLNNVFGFVAAAIVACAISGIGGTAGYEFFHSSETSPLIIWQHWFGSDAIGILAVAPVLIGLAAAARDRPPRRELIEGFSVLTALTLVSTALIFVPQEPWATVVPFGLLFPLLLWLAARCRPVFSSAAVFVIALTIVSSTTFGIGHFGDPEIPIHNRILDSQSVVLAVALCGFVLAALFAERRASEAALQQSEARLQEALTAGGVTAFDWDYRTGVSRRSNNAAQILGFDPRTSFSASQFVAHVHPDDRAHYMSQVNGVRPDHPSYVATFRFLRPDGRQVWLEETARAQFDGAGRRIEIRGLTLDITERKRAEAHQNTLLAELDHRVKNILARVAVVAMYTREGSSSMDEFVKALDGRIQSMADAHALLSKSRWLGVDLSDLVHRQLAPYTSNANTTISGPNVMLTAETTQAVAMVLQELVTNAVKYGALSTPNGRVHVNWGCSPDGSAADRLTIAWRETGGPPTVAPTQLGYGTSLIRDLIPHEIGGRIDLVFASDGLRCDIEIPVDRKLTSVAREVLSA